MKPLIVSGASAWALYALLALLTGALAFGGWRYYVLWQTHAMAVEKYEATVASLSEELAIASSTSADLATNLMNERARNDDLEDENDDLSGTVKKLDKLAKTDPELLAKYSKIYFLNENYEPPKLKVIPKEDTYDETRTFEFHAQAISKLEDMIEDADDDDVKLFVASAYRSFEEQAGLKSTYRITYGTGANAFSADQGYSEHQLGTTVDFTTTGINGGLTGFEQTKAYAWLLANAYKYGFVLSYPPGNAYYVYEPWHWRFVGKKLADKLHDDKEYFYSLDQRTIDKYLVSIFD